MRKIILVIMFTAVVVSCSPRMYPPSSVRDSVRVEIRERIVHDTAVVEIPLIVERTATRDTVSHLKNAYAESTASVSEGLLHHELKTRPQALKTPVTRVVHDTVRVEQRAETIIKEVPAELSRAQRGWMTLGKIAAGALVVLLLLVIGRVVVKWTK